MPRVPVDTRTQINERFLSFIEKIKFFKRTNDFINILFIILRCNGMSFLKTDQRAL